jgi:BASS family bile acid:Na+ symporter
MGYEGDHLIGVVVVGCVPGAMASNVLTHNAGGNTSYSVSLTTIATLISPLTVPLALWLILGRSDVRFSAVETSLGLLLTVVLPVAAGYAWMRLVPQFRKTLQHAGPIVANVVILWIIAIVVAKNREQLGRAALAVVPPLLAVNLAGYLAGNLGARAMRLPVDMRRALTLEIGMQNAGVGTFLVLTYFPERPAAAVAPAVYTFGCMFTGTALAHWWAWRARWETPSVSEGPLESGQIEDST